MGKKPFTKGDKVRTGHWERETQIVRKVLTCVASDCEGGWLVEADGGEDKDLERENRVEASKTQNMSRKPARAPSEDVLQPGSGF